VTDLTLLPSNLALGMGVVDVRGEQLQSTEAIEALAAAGAQVVAPECLPCSEPRGSAGTPAAPWPRFSEARGRARSPAPRLAADIEARVACSSSSRSRTTSKVPVGGPSSSLP
jgi:hypothetical protein